MHSSTIWRKVAEFRKMFGLHPNEAKVAGVSLDPIVVLERCRDGGESSDRPRELSGRRACKRAPSSTPTRKGMGEEGQPDDEDNQAKQGEATMSLHQWEKKVLEAPGAEEHVNEMEDEQRLAAGLTALREEAGPTPADRAHRSVPTAHRRH